MGMAEQLTVRWSAWYLLEETEAGWWVQPCICLSGLGEPKYVKLKRFYGPHPSRAAAVATGDALIERLEKGDGNGK